MNELADKKWSRYVIELIVIFVGISASLLVDEWRENGEERSLERKYLESLENALQLDNTSLKYLLAENQEKQTHIRLMLSGILAGDAYNQQIFADGIMATATNVEFIPEDATFQDLKSTGNILVISDYNLRGAMFEYYHYCQVLGKNDNSIDESINCAITVPVLEAIPLLEVFPLVEGSGQGRIDQVALSKNTLFLNAVAARLLQMDGQEMRYEGAAELSKKLLAQLGQQRKKLAGK